MTRTLNPDTETVVDSLTTSGSVTDLGALTVAGALSAEGGLSITGALGAGAISATSVSATSEAVTGLLQVSGGLSVEKNSSNLGFSPFPAERATTITASRAVLSSEAGVLLLTGSSPITLTLPSAASAIGAEFIIRGQDTNQHVVSSSADAGKRITGYEATSVSGSLALVQFNGSRATLDGTANSSLLLRCDGFSWLAMPITGAFAVAG